MELEKKNLEKEIEDIEEKINAMQKDWIKNQTKLIELQDRNSRCNRDCDDLTT